MNDTTWPSFIEARGATLAQAVDGLAASERWSAETLAEGQRRQLAHLLRIATKNVPWYGRAAWARPVLAQMDAHPGRFDELWRSIPPLTKPELREHAALLDSRSLPAAHLPLATTRTSGSIGIPVEVKTTAVSRLTWDALTVREHLWRERDFGKRLGVIRSRGGKERSPSGYDQIAWGPPVSQLRPSGRSSVIHIGLPVDVLVAWLKRFDPHYLLTYPSLARELLDVLGPGGRPPSLEEMRLISEPVDPDLERRLLSEWGVRTTDMYSANEVGVIAFRCREDRLHVQSEAILAEILDDAGAPCAAGETGRVVVTALHNIATPLLRYDIGDYATVGEPCPCGRSHPVIAAVRGRVRNLARAPDGRRYWPTALAKVRDVRPVRQFQFVQTALDTIELRVVLDRALTPEEQAAAGRIVNEVLGHTYRVVVRPVADIPRGPTGKFEEFMSELPP